nr:MAG TPA: hypothetical protein [Caudoviricetes sp.]
MIFSFTWVILKTQGQGRFRPVPITVSDFVCWTFSERFSFCLLNAQPN